MTRWCRLVRDRNAHRRVQSREPCATRQFLGTGPASPNFFNSHAVKFRRDQSQMISIETARRCADWPEIYVPASLFAVYQLIQKWSDRIYTELCAVVVGALDEDSSIAISQPKFCAFRRRPHPRRPEAPPPRSPPH